MFVDPHMVSTHLLIRCTESACEQCHYRHSLGLVRETRKRGLSALVLLMGYYNPLLRYGEEQLLDDYREASINSFIMVDLPPHEAVKFRNHCAKGG